MYGVAFVDEEDDFWELKFPPPPIWNVDLESADAVRVVQAMRDRGSERSRSGCVCAVGVDFEVLHLLRDPDGMEAGAEGNAGSDVEAADGTEDVAMATIAQGVQGSAGSPREWAESRAGDAGIGIGYLGRIGRRESLATGREEDGGSARAARGRGNDRHRGLPAPSLPPLASAVVAKAANRRRDVRTRVNFSACVRCEETEEIVVCANLSRRGFAFSEPQALSGWRRNSKWRCRFIWGRRRRLLRGRCGMLPRCRTYTFQYGVMYASALLRTFEASRLLKLRVRCARNSHRTFDARRRISASCALRSAMPNTLFFSDHA